MSTSIAPGYRYITGAHSSYAYDFPLPTIEHLYLNFKRHSLSLESVCAPTYGLRTTPLGKPAWLESRDLWQGDLELTVFNGEFGRGLSHVHLERQLRVEYIPSATELEPIVA